MKRFEFVGRVKRVHRTTSPMSTLKVGDKVRGIKAFELEPGQTVFHQQDVMLPGFLFAGKASVDVCVTKVKSC